MYIENRISRLAQGIDSNYPKGTNTILFISYQDIPQHKRKEVTYGRLVSSHRPLKQETHRVRMTVGGNRISYFGDVSAPTADFLLTKLILNSVISTPSSKFSVADIHDFYLNSTLPSPEYMFLPIDIIPEK